jgi:capsule polysaccharide export protein KpsE/RkpR
VCLRQRVNVSLERHAKSIINRLSDAGRRTGLRWAEGAQRKHQAQRAKSAKRRIRRHLDLNSKLQTYQRFDPSVQVHELGGLL